MKLLSKKVVRERCLISFAHIDRLEKVGKFPRRCKLGTHHTSRVGWVESEIDEWLSQRLAQRQAPT